MNTNLILSFNQDLLRRVLASAGAKGMSLNEYVESVLRETEEEADEPDPYIDLESAVAEAVKRAATKPAGALFELQDLFSAAEWSEVPSPRWFGRKFRPAVEKAGVASFEQKTQANKAIYRRS